MHDQHLAGGEIRKQIFGAAVKPLDARSDDPPREILRQWPTQILAVGPHGEERGALHRRGKAPPDRFDLGKFRHVYSVRRFPGIR